MLTSDDPGREFLGRGVRFPLAPDSRGQLQWSQAESSIEESIWLVLSTARRERVMLPEFGCGIHDLVFEPNSELVRGDVAADVQQALVRYEPRIDVLGVDVDATEGRAEVMVIRVDYRVRSTNTVHNLVYPFYITEGAR